MKILFDDLTNNIKNAEMFGAGYWITAEFDGLNHYLQVAIIDDVYVITDIDNIDYYIIEDCETLEEALLRFFNSWYDGYDVWQDRLSEPKNDEHEYYLCIIECN
ncbi:MAG: hypothetical protein K2M17_00955, partial [Bacilli bacterium]|nr:hypothetical protein [Bacilli bacterium]